ncbi:helix-turn-helix transcriptional regulator [Streptomyces canus]
MPRTFSGPALRSARRSAGLSVHDVAAAVDRSCWQIYRYEQGRAAVPLEVADALAEAVAVPLDRLLWSDPLAVAA